MKHTLNKRNAFSPSQTENKHEILLRIHCLEIVIPCILTKQNRIPSCKANRIYALNGIHKKVKDLRFSIQT